MQDLYTLAPEIFLSIMACLILVVDVYLKEKTKIVTYFLSQVALLTTLLLCLKLTPESTIVFSGHFVADALAQTLKVFILFVMFLVLLYSRVYISQRHIARGEYHILALFVTLGMMFLVSANSLIMIFLGVELLSLPLYTLIALNRDSSTSIEAAMKYFIMGSLASGMLLYGMSMLYGLTGSLLVPEIAQQILVSEGMTLSLLVFSLIFIVVGIAFKFGAVPFHMWVPDIYQGSPTSITLLVGSAPKIAAFGMAYRLLGQALPSLQYDWSQFLIVLSVLSLALGNIVAIAQTNVKRLFAYSTISHVGFILLGFLGAGQGGYIASMFYVIVYAISVAAGFGIIIILSHKGFEAENLTDFQGLGQRNPWLAFLMLLVLFSFAGVPPTVGFYAKFMVLSSLVDAGFTPLAAVAVFFTIIGAFYYLRLVKIMYFDKTDTSIPVSGGGSDMRVVLSFNALAILALGIFPGPILALCVKALGG